jgi:hypothetical protein
MTNTQDPQFNGTVHAGRREDISQFNRLYRLAYPHATEKNLRNDIKPENASSWVTYKNAEGEILIAMHLRVDGLVWLLADPAKSDSLVYGFLVLLQSAWETFAPYGLRGLEVIYAPSLEPLAQRLEEQGLIGKKTAIIRTARFDERILNPEKAN